MTTESKTKPLTALTNYRLLGRSGLRVSPLCYGCMNIADKHMAPDPEISRKLIESYMEKGGNFFDTADVYEKGRSEELLGKVLAQHRSKSVIATKYTGNTSPGDPNAGGNSRKNLLQSLDGSLKRLGVGYVDLLYVHMWNHRTPVEEVMQTMDDVCRSGKVLYCAVSDCVAWKIAQANTLASLKTWPQFIALQTQYSLVERTADRDLIPMCKEFDIGIVNWGPLAQGMLAGKYNKIPVEKASAIKASLTGDREQQNKVMQSQAVPVDTFRPKAVLGDWNEKNRAVALKVEEIASKNGVTSAQVAFNWNLQQPAVTSPIFGVRNQEQLDDVVGSMGFTLSAEDLAALDAVSKVDLGFPQRWGQGEFFVVKGGIKVEKRFGTPQWTHNILKVQF